MVPRFHVGESSTSAFSMLPLLGDREAIGNCVVRLDTPPDLSDPASHLRHQDEQDILPQSSGFPVQVSASTFIVRSHIKHPNHLRQLKSTKGVM